MEITSAVYKNNTIVLEVKGEVDAHTAKELNKTLTDSIAQGYYRIVIDVSRLTFISSAGLRAIMFAHREVAQLGGEVRLVGPSIQTRRTFEIAGAFELMNVSDNLQEALGGWQ